MESYSRTERALIFYNHLRVSGDVPRAAKRRPLLADRAYMRVVDHPSYNPRLIEWMTGLSGQKLGNPQLSNYPRYCVAVLDHPEQLWAFAFDQGISYEAQLMLYALAGLPRLCALGDLERSSAAIWHAASRTAGARRLTRALRELDDSFVRTLRVPGSAGAAHAVQVLNPSLIDFLQERLVEDSEATRAVLEGAPFFDQVQWVAERLLERDALDADLVPVLVRAADRTLHGSAPTRWTGRPSRSASAGAKRRSATRNRRLGWLASQSESATRERSQRADVGNHRSDETCNRQWAPAVYPADTADAHSQLCHRRVGVGDRGRIDEAGTTLATFEAARDLRAAAHTAYNRQEWDELADEFWAWQGEALDEPNEYFDDPDELDRAVSLADELGRPL